MPQWAVSGHTVVMRNVDPDANLDALDGGEDEIHYEVCYQEESGKGLQQLGVYLGSSRWFVASEITPFYN